ncbi:protein phosphatase 1 regulatory subunit 37-like [Teleopsis dalmanni]|uniref:protein phosphatase 1 regulatory subunit 37-like n=1 Tax=Teleopsis dalmanni TaxID=139649 RepID=UPI0018CE5D7D|nr:protein phosphatase 1 regulatory subunit 37-like [Teleopsis dalmanni]
MSDAAKKTVSELKNMCKTIGLSAHGDKATLVARLKSSPNFEQCRKELYVEIVGDDGSETCMVKSISEITELYVLSCYKHNTKPLPVILEHLKGVETNKQLRQGQLSLKSIQLSPSDCEALEEVFKRVQYKSINFSSCDLSESALSALFDMIEYYEATNELDISLNAKGMTHRGWVSCTYMVSRSQELQSLNAQGNPISKSSAENLGHALKTSNLHTLKLEHCGLKGAPLTGLCFKLRCNRILKELWIAYNDLDSKDAETIADLLKLNHYLEFVDISNNNIRDEGIQCVVNALILQSSELERRSVLHRAAAIDDDESLSPINISPAIETADLSINSLGKTRSVDDLLPATKANTINNDRTNTNNEDLDDNAFEPITNNTNEIQCNAPKVENQTVKKLAKTIETQESDLTTLTAASTGIANTLSVTPTGIEENDLDEDTEDTVKSSTIKNSVQAVGQSMLDKLLSMNSDSSSEEGASNLSTDTVAPCYSEDASIISDDIFDGALTATTNTSTNSKAECIVASTPTCVSAIDVIISTSVDKHVTQDQLQMEKENVISEYKNFEEAINSESNSNSNNSNSVTSTTITSLGNHNNNNNNVNNNNDVSDNNSSDNYSIHHNDNSHLNLNPLRHATSDDSTLQSSGIFEVTADESDCLISNAVSDRESDSSHSLLLHHSAKVLDVNKNTKLSEDYDDTHSTDSAFESASECDISRNLPEEFSRLSVSLESTRLDDIVKELAIETATIATESTECLIEAAAVAAAAVPSSSALTPPTPPLTQLYSHVKTPEKEKSAEVSDDCFYTNFVQTPTTKQAIPQIETLNTENNDRVNTTVTVDDFGKAESCFHVDNLETATLIQPKVTIAEDSIIIKHKECANSPRPTPPPPSTSPGGVSLGMRRTESSSAFITQSTRNRSQSSDSLCSDNSLDSSISSDLNFSTSIHINEKLTKNDTLTRQQRQTDTTIDVSNRAPNGLKALAVWNNNLTKESGRYISELMSKTESLELLNIGKNCLSNEFVTLIKDSLTKNTTITTLGLQSAHLSAKGIETLASILTFGGNNTLQRIDIRDNKLEAESLETLAEVLKSNTTVTQIDIDDEPKRLSLI